jgi:hypothetical protein
MSGATHEPNGIIRSATEPVFEEVAACDEPSPSYTTSAMYDPIPSPFKFEVNALENVIHVLKGRRAPSVNHWESEERNIQRVGHLLIIVPRHSQFLELVIIETAKDPGNA